MTWVEAAILLKTPVTVVVDAVSETEFEKQFADRARAELVEMVHKAPKSLLSGESVTEAGPMFGQDGIGLGDAAGGIVEQCVGPGHCAKFAWVG